jgi:hypothetical protein
MCLTVVPLFYCNQSFKFFCFVLDELKTHLRSCFPFSLKPWNFGSDRCNFKWKMSRLAHNVTDQA